MPEDKVQLNLYVSPETAAIFRKEATACGMGKRPSPLLDKLLEAYQGEPLALTQALARVVKRRPAYLQETAQRTQLLALNEQVETVLFSD